jgi:hypothetical protein
MKKIWSILMLALSVIGVRAATVTYNQTNGQLLYPTGFFRQHIIPGQGMVTQYGTGSNTLTLYVLTNSPSSPGMLPPWQTNALWSNGTWEQWSNLFRGNSNVVITQTPTGMVFSLTNVAASSSGMTIESTPATNLFSFGIIDLDDFGGGNWGIDINNSTIGTNKWTDAAYNWVLSLGGAGGGTTNGFGVNGVYRTDWNFLNSAVIVSTTSGGTNFYLSIVDGSIGTNKFDATAYNLLITDAVGLGTNALVNGIKRQPFALTNNPGTGGVIWVTNASGEVLAYATNIPSGGGGGGLGTNFVLNGTLMQPAIITNGLSVVWSTNASGHIQASVSLVDSNIPSAIARLESPVFTGTVTFSNLFVSNLQIPFASRYVWANGSSNLAATSDGASWTNLNGSSIATGTVADARVDAALARLTSPTFTGDPKVPTASSGDNDTSAASTAFLAQRIPGITYDATTWNGNTNAPTMDAVRDKIETMGGGGGSGTNVFVNNVLSQPAKFTNSPTLIWTTNASGDILGTITNVAGSTTSDVMQRTGWGLFSSGASSIANVATNGVVQSITHQAGDSMTEMVVSVVLTARSSTNYLVTIEVYNTNDLDTEGPAFVNISDKTTTGFKIQASSASSGAQPNGFWFRVWIAETTTVGGSGGGGGDALTTNPLSQFAATTSSQLSGVISDETGTGASVFAGSPALTGSPTVGGTNLMDYVAGHLTESEASALYHRTNSTLTRLGGIGAGSQGDLLYRDATGWTNLAKGTQGQFLAVTATVPAWSNAPSGGGTWDGTPIASGTITNLITSFVNGVRPFNPQNGDMWSDGYQVLVGLTAAFEPWSGASVNSGTANNDTAFTGSANDPMRIIWASASGANSGSSLSVDVRTFLVAGGEQSVHTVYIYKTNATVLRAGYLDVFSNTEPTDGVYLEMVGGVIYGKTSSNSSRTETVSRYTVSENSTLPLGLHSLVNSNASSVTFAVYTNGVSAWTDTVTNNIPTGAGRYTGHGAVAYHTGSGAGTNIIAIGALGALQNRVLLR